MPSNVANEHDSAKRKAGVLEEPGTVAEDESHSEDASVPSKKNKMDDTDVEGNGQGNQEETTTPSTS